MKQLDKMALKWITAQAKLNSMIAVNKSLLNQVQTLIEINKELRKAILTLKSKQNERSK